MSTCRTANAEAVAEAFRHTFDKAREEHAVLKALEQGMSMVEAFATFGII
jgi:hypothetical protein